MRADRRPRGIGKAVGKRDFGTCAPLLKEGGIYMSSELGPGNETLYLPLLTALRGGKRVVFPIPQDIPRTMRLMAQLLAKGGFRPLIDRTYPLQDIVSAHRYVESGQKIGNVVVRVADGDMGAALQRRFTNQLASAS